MKFAHRILINQPVSFNLCRSQVLPVPASPVLSSICFLTYAIPRKVSGLLLSVYRLTVFDCLFSCSGAYRLHLNSTTVSLFTIAPRMGVVRSSQQLWIVVYVFGQHHPADPRELLRRYRRLWEIETCFRTNRQDLRIRPIYHWKPKRVRAHIAICYMAFCCVQHVRYRLRMLGHEMSADVIHRELNALQVSILVEGPGHDQYGMPSRASSDARRIYRSVGLSWNELPFAVSTTDRQRKPATSR